MEHERVGLGPVHDGGEAKYSVIYAGFFDEALSFNFGDRCIMLAEEK